MFKTYSAMLAVAISVPLPALAQSPAPTAAAVATIPLDRLCSAEGALDLRFGDRVDGAQKGNQSEPLLRELDALLLPFDYAELGYSRYSQKLSTIGYLATFSSADAASEAAEILVDKAQALNWNLVAQPRDVEGLFEYSFSSKPEQADPVASDETMLSISVDEASVSIRCENAALATVQLNEAFGKMPVGMPKPQLVDYQASISSFTENDCDDPAKRSAFEADISAGNKAVFSPNWSRLTFEEDLVNWKIMKLTSSGKTDFDRINGQIIGLFDNTDSKETMESSMRILEDFGDELESLDSQDIAATCRATLKMLKRSEDISAPRFEVKGDAITPQWQATHEMLDKEAKRLGVSFDS